MAKGNMLLGTLRGSIGDVTYSRTNGAQISKAKSTSPRNPRTSKQIYQRMFFATIAKAQSAMKNIVDHSFEQVAHGSKSLQYFSKRNIALMRQTATFSDSLQTWVAPGMGFVPPKANSFTWNPYRVSEGSLPKLNVPNFLRTLPEDVTGELKNMVPTMGTVSPNYSDVSQYNNIDNVLRNSSAKLGDYFTLVFITAKEDDIAQGAGVFYNCLFKYVRYKVCSIKDLQTRTEKLILLPSNVNGVNYVFPDEFDESSTGSLPLLNSNSLMPVIYDNDSKMLSMVDLTEQNWELTYTDRSTQGLPGRREFYFDAPIASDDVILAATWIHSRPVSSSKLLVSTQDMLLADPTGDVYDFNLGLIDAYDEWNELVKQVGDNTYILQGGNASAGA